jgi:phenylacetate-CoA ligase
MRRLGLTPADLATPDDLKRLPILERAQLQSDPEAFRSQAPAHGSRLELLSGGSSGQPITVQWDRRAVVEIGAYRERHRTIAMRFAGKRVRLREALVLSPMDSTSHASRTFATSALIPQGLRVERLVLSVADPPARNLAAINDFRPDVVGGYGSYVEELFAYVRATGSPFARPAAVLYGGDPVSSSMRALITGEGVEVISAYGSVEAFNIGFECERHSGLHVNADFTTVRIAGPGGEDAAPGESGDVVVSNLLNHATVVLNYRLGDLAALVPEPCPCGRSLPLMTLPEGRLDDWFEMPDGRRVHPQVVRSIVSGTPGVWRYQIVVLAPGRLRVDVVHDPAADRPAARDRIVSRIVEAFGAGAEVEVAEVTTLPKSARGKVRPVISLAERERLDAAGA